MGFQDTFETRVRAASDRAFGHDVTLTRAGNVSASFTATWEAQEYEVEDGEGFLTKFHSRDFMFDKAAPVLAGAAVKPRAGDVLTITENSEEKRFEVLPIGSRPAVGQMDGGYRWRVHTKRVA